MIGRNLCSSHFQTEREGWRPSAKAFLSSSESSELRTYENADETTDDESPGICGLEVREDDREFSCEECELVEGVGKRCKEAEVELTFTLETRNGVFAILSNVLGLSAR